MTTGRINQVFQTLAVRPFLGHVHTQIRDLKTQAAHAAHQPQAARSQPNARGAVGLSGAVRKRVRRRSRSARGPAAWPSASNCRRAIASRGQQPLAHGLGRELRVEDALGRGRQLLDQIGLGPLPEEPRALVGCEAHAGALALGKSPVLPWDFQQSFALPKQRLQAHEFATSPKFHMLAWLVTLFCLRLKKDWSEHAKLLEPLPRLCVLRCAGGGYKTCRDCWSCFAAQSRLAEPSRRQGGRSSPWTSCRNLSPRSCVISGAGTTRCFRRGTLTWSGLVTADVTGL